MVIGGRGVFTLRGGGWGWDLREFFGGLVMIHILVWVVISWVSSLYENSTSAQLQSSNFTKCVLS